MAEKGVIERKIVCSKLQLEKKKSSLTGRIPVGYFQMQLGTEKPCKIHTIYNGLSQEEPHGVPEALFSHPGGNNPISHSSVKISLNATFFVKLFLSNISIFSVSLIL